MPSMTEAIIGIIGFSCIVALTGIFMSTGATTFGIPYDNSTIGAYNQLSEVSQQAQDLQTSAENIQSSKTGVFDFFGGLFNDAWRTMKMTFKSFDLVIKLINQAIHDLNLGPAGSILRIGITSIILVTIVLGILVAWIRGGVKI